MRESLGTAFENIARIVCEATFQKGQMHAYGIGTEKNDAKAARLFRQAAEKGHPDAQYHLAFMHADGYGMPRNDEEAVKWFEKAAAQGHVKAQFNLGLMYADGRGVEQDTTKAVELFCKVGRVEIDPSRNVGCQIDDHYMAAMWLRSAASDVWVPYEFVRKDWTLTPKKLKKGLNHG